VVRTVRGMELTTTFHLASLPDERAAHAPDAPCVDDDRQELNSAEFADRVRAVAEDFRQRGVGPGDVVAVMLPNQVELIVVMFAAWRVGAALTPINPSLTSAEASYQIVDSGARLLVCNGTAIEVGGVAVLHVGALSTAPPVGDPAPLVDSSALALLIYTSGTTGAPKGVMLDHANLSAMASMIVDALRLTPEDRCLLILPLFHVNGIMVSVVAPLAAGGSTTITGRFSPTTFFETVEAVRPSYFSAVPTIYAMLAGLPDDHRPDTSSVRFAICGAAPMPAELIGRFEGRYGLPIVEGYGLSECTCAATINPVDGRRKPGTVGLPLAGQDVALRADDGHIGHEGRGEVVLRGPNVMRGYLNRAAETAAAMADGWLRTGDVGQFDDDGYLVLVDRVKDMIIRGGENIYPKEIEDVLYAHPAVLEAAVVGRPDDVYGEEPVAFVALRPGSTTTADELLEHARTTLARFKVPRQLFVLDSLPKNPLGKIVKQPLRDRVSRAGDGAGAGSRR
jgi:long-chain acyl-CoA synthetase